MVPCSGLVCSQLPSLKFQLLMNPGSNSHPPVGSFLQRYRPNLSAQHRIVLLVRDRTVGPAGATSGVEVPEILPVAGGELLQAGVSCPGILPILQ